MDDLIDAIKTCNTYLLSAGEAKNELQLGVQQNAQYYLGRFITPYHIRGRAYYLKKDVALTWRIAQELGMSTYEFLRQATKNLDHYKQPQEA